MKNIKEVKGLEKFLNEKVNVKLDCLVNGIKSNNTFSITRNFEIFDIDGKKLRKKESGIYGNRKYEIDTGCSSLKTFMKNQFRKLNINKIAIGGEEYSKIKNYFNGDFYINKDGIIFSNKTQKILQGNSKTISENFKLDGFYICSTIKREKAIEIAFDETKLHNIRILDYGNIIYKEKVFVKAVNKKSGEDIYRNKQVFINFKSGEVIEVINFDKGKVIVLCLEKSEVDKIFASTVEKQRLIDEGYRGNQNEIEEGVIKDIFIGKKFIKIGNRRIKKKSIDSYHIEKGEYNSRTFLVINGKKEISGRLDFIERIVEKLDRELLV